MQKSCKQCQAAFEITDNDLAFYEKVSPTFAGKKTLIPPPSFCAECRQQRRLAHRNENRLYKRTSDRSFVISIFHPDTPFHILSVQEWWGDSWNGCDYGKEPNFASPFFKTFRELLSLVPRMAVLQSQNENSEFTNCVSNLKDCYLINSSDYNRNCYYGTWIERCLDCTDDYVIQKSELTYESVFSDGLSRCKFTTFSRNCHDSSFLFDCQGCSDCLLCWNLRNQHHCYQNRQLTKEEYDATIANMRLDTASGQQKQLVIFERLISERAIHLFMWRKGRISKSSGDWLSDVERCHECFSLVSGKDCTRASDGYELRDAMDCDYVSREMGYENCECFPMPYQSAFNINSYEGSGLYYCDLCMNCNNCFGCVGLKHQNHCILNTQYTKEEYERLVPRLIEHMRKTGEWGEFFPTEISPFAYNETVAQEFFPLTQEEVEARGWTWREQRDEMPKVSRIISAQQLPDGIDDIPDDILNWAIECEVTKRPFKIIKQELDFYRQMRLPVPRRHPDERHKRRMALRNPRKLWNRTCAKCAKDIRTTYAPERKEIVYCEECYLKEVY